MLNSNEKLVWPSGEGSEIGVFDGSLDTISLALSTSCFREDVPQTGESYLVVPDDSIPLSFASWPQAPGKIAIIADTNASVHNVGKRLSQILPGHKDVTWHLPPLTLYLAAPRGFCAGVDRAIKMVEMALEKFGAPVYVRHEIVHNRFVVDGLREQGAVFVEDLDDCPDDRPVIFSAHGSPKSVIEAAKKRDMFAVDAVCPLVTKVHMEIIRLHKQGYDIVLIGHQGHVEVIGTMGQLPPGAVTLIETVEDVAGLAPANPDKLAYVTQTTLSVDDTADVIAALKTRFPAILGPGKEDICYATTNRQASVKAIAPKIDALVVIGAENSSNSKRLVEVGAKAGCTYAVLVPRAAAIDWAKFEGVRSVGITAGASAPEVLVNEVVDAFKARYDVTVETVETAVENIEFKAPRILREPA